jgi:hypothetical protein
MQLSKTDVVALSSRLSKYSQIAVESKLCNDKTFV